MSSPCFCTGHLWQSQAELRRSHPTPPCGLRRGRQSPFLPVLPHGASWRRRVKRLALKGRTSKIAEAFPDSRDLRPASAKMRFRIPLLAGTIDFFESLHSSLPCSIGFPLGNLTGPDFHPLVKVGAVCSIFVKGKGKRKGDKP